MKFKKTIKSFVHSIQLNFTSLRKIFLRKRIFFFTKNKKLSLEKPSPSFKKNLGNSGQGVIEYILFLSLSTLMILGMIYQLNSAFSFWAKNYFGDYLACLIETGELPTLGGKTSIGAGECNGEYKAFSIKDGRPLIKGEGIKSEGKDSEGKNSENNQKSSSKSSTSYESSQSENASTASAKEWNEDSFSLSSSTRNRSRNRKKTISKKSTSSKNKKDGSEGLKTLNVSKVKNFERREEVPLSESDFFTYGSENIGDGTEEEEKVKIMKKKKKDDATQRAIAKRKELILINKKKKQQVQEIEIEPLTFGNFFRYLVIAGIVIALFALIGGQFLQIKDSLK